jgi:hypothetical protein
MNIHILTIPNEEIKARAGFTGADWYFDDAGDLQIRIAKMSSLDREKCLALHEMCEALVFHAKHGPDVSAVDEFDSAFEAAHPENHGLEAGDADGCSYAVEHALATSVERALFTYLAMLHPDIGSWSAYDRELGAL